MVRGMRKNITEAITHKGQKFYDPPIWAVNAPKPIALAIQGMLGNPHSKAIEYVSGHEERRFLNWIPASEIEKQQGNVIE